jgi:hypothetical protein
LYPSTGKGVRGLGLGNKEPPLPTVPTEALPGSPEKVAVLEERVKLGLALWHPADPTIKTHRTGLSVIADAPEKAEMITLYLAGETVATVATRFDCSKATVYKVLKLAGATKRNQAARGFADWTGHRWHG